MRRFRPAEAKLRRDSLRILKAALDAAASGKAVHHHLSRSRRRLTAGNVSFNLDDYERIFLVAVGKAAVPMAQAVETIAGDLLEGEIVVTKQGHAGDRRLRHCVPIEARHPIPDRAGEAAARSIERFLRGLTARDLLLVAISGGASALLPAPAPPVTLAAKQKTTDLLLRAGANIQLLNAVRKHLSFLKGGWLASLAFPATIVALLLSDVVGDAPDVIGSGLTAPDPTTFADALAVLHQFHLLNRVPASVRGRLQDGATGAIEETPKPGNSVFRNVHNIVIGSNRLALEAAAQEARRLGFRTLILSSSLEGETGEVASVHSQILREIMASGNPVKLPSCILSSGETTVTVRARAGRGGRNQEFALAAALRIAGLENAAVLSAGTDGTDGPTDAAGAIATGSTIDRARKLGLDAADHLARHDSYPFFDALGDLIRTGPTGTNVMDIHLLLASS